MDYLHLARKENIDSISTHGIVPSYVKLEHHWETFNRYGLENRKCVYVWNGETFNNTKFIKDMIYTKFFIHPRNDVYDVIDHEVDFRNVGKKIFGTDEIFFLLRIHSFDDKFGEWTHVQEPDGDRYGTTVNMSDKYAHDDKRISISDSIIKPNQFDIVEKINVRTYNENQLGFSFLKI